MFPSRHLVDTRGYSSFDISTYLHLTSHRARRRVVEIGFVLMLRVPEHTTDAVALFLSPRASNSENHSVLALRRSTTRFHVKKNRRCHGLRRYTNLRAPIRETFIKILIYARFLRVYCCIETKPLPRTADKLLYGTRIVQWLIRGVASQSYITALF